MTSLLITLTALLALATVVSLDVKRDELGAGVALTPLVVPLSVSYFMLMAAGSLAALGLARRAARAVETLFEHQDRLMLAVAHEIRSPLSRTFVALEEGATGARACEAAIDEARVNVEALSSLIEDLLQTARIMAGAIDLPDDEVRLDEVARSSVAGEHLGASTVQFDTQPILVVGSPHLMRRAVINLIRNAAVHGYGQGEGTIRVRVDHHGVTVQDTGPGVPAAELETLRYETPTDRRHGRTGLGLLLAGWVAEAHQGQLVLDNRPGGGFEAALRLPVRSWPPVGDAADAAP